MDKETLTMPRGLMQALADYLQHRPYGEVAGFMQAISQITHAHDPSDVEGVS